MTWVVWKSSPTLFKRYQPPFRPIPSPKIQRKVSTLVSLVLLHPLAAALPSPSSPRRKKLIFANVARRSGKEAAVTFHARVVLGRRICQAQECFRKSVVPRCDVPREGEEERASWARGVENAGRKRGLPGAGKRRTEPPHGTGIRNTGNSRGPGSRGGCGGLSAEGGSERGGGGGGGGSPLRGGTRGWRG